MGFAISNMQIVSSAFEHGGPIPERHTGDGDDISPALSWTNAPEGTRQFALICHDPDAPLIKPGSYGFVHWVLYNIAGSANGLDEGVGDYMRGINDFGNEAYGGPMPPEGHGAHHYFFWLLALDAAPELPAGLEMWQLLDKIEPHVIGMNRLMGTYSRS